MKGKTILSLAIVLAMILAAIPFAAVKAAPDFTLQVVFDETGTSSLTKGIGSDFNVSVKVFNAPNVDFMSIKVHWDPTMVQLKDMSTDLDVLTGGFMDTFWGPSSAGTHLATGTLDDVTGFDSGPASHGNGIAFRMLFHCLAAGVSTIGVVGMNLDSYFMMGTTQNNLDSVTNATIEQALPPATPPKAKISSPVDGSIVTVGDTVNLVGTGSTDGFDTSPPPGEVCHITTWDWTIDFNNGTIIHLFGATQSFVCAGAGMVTITLTVTAPDPHLPSAPGYIDHDTSAPINIMQLPAAAGPGIDVYTARGGEGPLGVYPFGWSDAYGPQEEVCVFAKVTYNGAPVEYKPVEFVIMDNNGDERDSRTAFTNASGIATVCFRIPWQGSDAENYFGDWSIYGTVDISQVQVSDTVMFRFGYILYIDTITIDVPAGYHKGDTMTIDVTIGSIAMADYDAFLQISAHDNCNVPIGQAFATITVPALGYSALGNTIVIPDWAYVGVGVIYVDLLTSKFGLPYCPEKTIGFIIVYP
jgi:hypothetical protein